MSRLMVSVLLLSLVFASFGYAEDREEAGFSQRLKGLEEQVQEIKSRVEGGTGLRVSGFVDASFFYDDNAGSSTFSLDEVEVDIIKELSAGISIRTDLNFRNMDDDDGSLDAGDILEQGYMTFRLPIAEPLDFTFGKFNAPIGFELLDPVDMFQFSHALVFDLGIPTNVTGVMLTSKPTDALDINLYLVNGWDQLSDNNKDKTVGGRIGLTVSEKVGFGVSFIYGVERADEDSDKRFVLDLDATLNPSESTLIGLEVNYGTEENVPQSLPLPDKDADWLGFLIMVHHDLTPSAGVTLRYDFFDDKDAGRTGTVQQLQAVTLALTLSLSEGAGVLAEYRHDWSDVDSFVLAGGAMDDSNDSLALEFTYSF